MRKRNDIQALRALAVSLVLVFHVWPAALPGGFVGVDVFFVISGYLITRLLLRELDSTGSVSLLGFWARRIRRLLPAGFVTLIACVLLALAFLPSHSWRQHFLGIAASAFYVQNWHLVATATDYAMADGEATIAQHFWSLAVEEQFYLLWPLLLTCVTLLFKTRRRRAYFALSIGICVVSLGYSIYESNHGKALAYFSTFTRAWEFVAGALIVFLPALRSEYVALRTALAWTGLSAIFVSAVITSVSDPFPGYIALVPVVGTMFVIYSASDDIQIGLLRLLSWRPVTWLGDASYSVYLWHWPLVIVAPKLISDPLASGASVLLLTLMLAGLSKNYVEDPFLRSDRWTQLPTRAWYGFAATGMLSFVAITVPFLQRADAEADPIELEQYLENPLAAIEYTLSLDEWPLSNEPPGRTALPVEWTEHGCLGIVDEATADRCTYGPQEAAKTMILIGDSWAFHFLPALRSGFPEWRIRVLTLGQCPIANVDVHEFDRLDSFEACITHRSSVLDSLSTSQADLIIAEDSDLSTLQRLMSGNRGKAAYDELKAGYQATFSKLAQLPVPVVVLTSPLQVNCSSQVHESPVACQPNEVSDFQRMLTMMKLSVASENGLGAVDTVGYFCSTDLVCPNLIGNILVKADASHISGRFSRALGPVLAKEILRSAREVRRGLP